MWQLIRKTITEAVTRYVPSFVACEESPTCKRPPWMNAGVNSVLRKKKKAYTTKYLKSKNGADYTDYTNDRTRSIWKMLGPFAHNKPPHANSPGVATVLSHAACTSMSTTPTTTMTTRDRGPLWPMEWAQIWQKLSCVKLCAIMIKA